MAVQAQTASVASLRAHPLAEAIYGNVDDTLSESEDSLLASISTQGVLTPLLVTQEGTVVAGRERLRVARELGITVVPVRVLELTDAAGIEEALIESNVARRKTVEQRVREYRELKRIEAVRAASRQGSRSDLLENLPGGEGGGDAGNARDLAATKVGWSGRTAEKGAQVLDAIEAREAAGENQQLVEELRDTLNSQSVDAAHQRAAEFGWLPGKVAKGKAERGGNPERRVKGAFQRATTAATKLAEIVSGEVGAAFTPEHVHGLRAALQPVVKWYDGQGRA